MTDEAIQLSSLRRRPFRAERTRRAFTIVECLIAVLALIILATLVVPQFSRASQESKQNMLKDALHFMRTQVAVFKAQHQDVPPGYPDGNPASMPDASVLAQQLTQRTDLNCRIGAPGADGYPYGPYIHELPANPINGLSSVEMVGNNQAMPKPDGKTGWIYIPQTQEIIANLTGKDASGTPYSSY